MTKAQKRLKREKNKLKNKNIMRQHSKRNEDNKGVSKKEDKVTQAVYPVKASVPEKKTFTSSIKSFFTRKK
jgi:hypothetical protein